MVNWNERHNFFDNDTLAAEWYNHVVNRVKWHIFENQSDIVYMVGELGEGRNPKLKEDALEQIEKIVVNNLSVLIYEMTMNCAKDLIDDDVDCDMDTAEELNWHFGYEEGDDNFIHGVED